MKPFEITSATPQARKQLNNAGLSGILQPFLGILAPSVNRPWYTAMDYPNQHLYEYLEWYAHLPSEPGFALMIKGPWGCGKTYTVDKALERFQDAEKPVKALHVSLYGLASLDDVEARFFQQLSPLLASKGMMWTSRIAKGLLKATIKFDLDDDGTSDGSVTATIPELDLSQIKTDAKGHLIIFDDLERCEMPLGQILGYINYLVEKNGYKCVIIADEEKLKGMKASEHATYENVIEKVVGARIEVVPDVEGVFDAFVDDAAVDEAGGDLSKQLAEHKSSIITCFNRSRYRNLRSLRKTILDFTRLWGHVRPDLQREHKLITALITRFTILSMEIHSGQIQKGDLPELLGSTFSRAFKRSKASPLLGLTDEEPLSRFDQMDMKYGDELRDAMLSPEIWEAIFFAGHIDEKAIDAELRESRHFKPEALPDWQQFWYLFQMSDPEFQKLHRSVENGIVALEYREPGQILHIAGMYLEYTKLGFIEGTTAAVKQRFVEYIDSVFPESRDVDLKMLDCARKGVGLYRLEFRSTGTEEFDHIRAHLSERVGKAYQASLIRRHRNVLNTMMKDARSLRTLLCFEEGDYHEYQRFPILKYIDPSLFVAQLKKLHNYDKYRVAEALKNRYVFLREHDQLLEEEEWLNQVRDVNNPKKNYPRAPSDAALDTVNDAITTAIERIELTKRSILNPDSAGDESE